MSVPGPIGCRPTVFFLHGLGRGPQCFNNLKREIEAQTNLRCYSIGYPSSSKPLDKLAAHVVDEIQSKIEDGTKVFMVTHSLGGIVVRYINGLPEKGGLEFCGIVMLAPPNKGSGLARLLNGSIGPVFKTVCGQAAAELACNGEEWPLPPRPCGVIAGTKPYGINPISWVTTSLNLLKGPHDGTVAVEETKLPDCMDDFTTVDGSHTFLMSHPEIASLVLNFLNHAKFSNSSLG